MGYELCTAGPRTFGAFGDRCRVPVSYVAEDVGRGATEKPGPKVGLPGG